MIVFIRMMTHKNMTWPTKNFLQSLHQGLVNSGRVFCLSIDRRKTRNSSLELSSYVWDTSELDMHHIASMSHHVFVWNMSFKYTFLKTSRVPSGTAWNLSNEYFYKRMRVWVRVGEIFLMIGIDRAHRVVSGTSVGMIARSKETNPCLIYWNLHVF